ncbi:metal-dependent phosphohydrolase [Nocardia transvalensis]|uniref:metal-dependent phosphohydrolase n=1 Tax=Nocardia transvalensis TaxID=37333 RepID=UPI001894A64A|nr:metal-dependent phosphohydrolase [Nocardia transvalensis]MBF6334130.1 metal-dependent phosphohydrolase [Nocardia transvalensis]
MRYRAAPVECPDSPLARTATGLLVACAPPVLVNHCQRAYQFGWALGEVHGWTVDPELLYICAVLHDLGLTERFDGPAGFELEGAAAAAEFLREQGCPADRVAIVSDAIAVHLDANRDRGLVPEIDLTAMGSGLDTHALRVDALDRSFLDAVLDAWPRLGFRHWLREKCCEQARRKPESKVAWWVRSGMMPEDMGSPHFTE